MAHEGHRHAGVAVERLLEGEDHEHVRDALADRAHPPAAPGPHLRRDVVDDGDAPARELPGEAQVEVGVVHEDGDGRRLAVDLVEDAPEDPPQPAQVAQHLEEAHHGEVADVGEEARALGLQAVAAEAEDLHGTRLTAEVADELARVEVARGLATGDEHPPVRGRSGRGAQDGGSI